MPWLRKYRVHPACKSYAEGGISLFLRSQASSSSSVGDVYTRNALLVDKVKKLEQENEAMKEKLRTLSSGNAGDDRPDKNKQEEKMPFRFW